ncbi:MAG: diguanylate cyclase [Deltaproteobacteria bacterium]|nr:diguanylate cyclase [Deltaproteobacteria bacterium]MDQ3300941.1 diguanylate cyclase [Myxococcota bacterium]
MLIAIGGIGWLDVVTGAEIGMSLFYLAPVAVTAWFVGLRPGIALAVVAASAWYASDLTWHAETIAISSWNGFTRLAIYVGTSVLLSLLHADRRRLHALLSSAEQSARTDPLTGLANSRSFYERLRDELPRLQRRPSVATLAYLDVDNFKRVNDQLGHAVGDVVLKSIADALRASLRAGDFAARLGGDEFAIVLWDTNLENAESVAARIVAAVEHIAEQYPGTGLGSSIGLSELDPAKDVEAALRAADAAMYAIKSRRKADKSRHA